MDEPPQLLSPTDVEQKARRSLNRNLKVWLFDSDGASLTVRLGSPSEAHVAANRPAVEAWVRAWQSSPLDVRWEERKWPSLGRQLLPTAVTLEGADAVAVAARAEKHWHSAKSRRGRLEALDSGHSWRQSVAAAFRHWINLSDPDFVRLIAVISWLRQNPDSGLLVRQLPIPDVDTKWLSAHHAAVIALAVPLGIPEHLGLRERELLRAVAILDPALRQRLPRLFAASDRDLAALDLTAPRVLVVENLQTMEALPDLPNTVAVFGWGGHSLAVADFPWVRKAWQVFYWGDLDTDGFAILARFRAKRPCTSVLMDRATLERWRRLAVSHPASDGVDTTLLTSDERAALELLIREGLRLEQERLPIHLVCDSLTGD